MPSFQIVVTDDASKALKQIAPEARAALRSAMAPLARKLTQDVRAKALAHIHTFGAKPGLYLASIHGGVSDKDARISGYVRTGNQLAHLLEYGTASHAIVAKRKQVLASADQVFGRVVNVSSPAYPAFDVLEGRREEVEAAMTQAVKSAAKGAAT